MAAESLENTAKEMGYTIKVETNGSGGDKNVLTAEDIANCDCIIVAADKDVKWRDLMENQSLSQRLPMEFTKERTD